MIVADYKIMYFHVRKCGGTSIKNSFKRLKSFDRNFMSFGVLTPEHSDKYSYGGPWDRARYEDWFKFTSVRNPYDRLVSLYFYLKKRREHRSWRLSFTDFCMRLNEISDDSNFMKLHLSPAYDMLVDGFGPIYNFLIRCESFDEDWGRLNAIVGYDGLELKKENTTSHRHYSEYYNGLSRGAAAKFFCKDLDYFGYDF